MDKGLYYFIIPFCRIDEDGFQTSFDASNTAIEEKFGNQQTGFWDPIGRFQKFWQQVSRNVPINFLTRPDKSAFNLVLALGFVSLPCYIPFTLNIKRMITVISFHI